MILYVERMREKEVLWLVVSLKRGLLICSVSFDWFKIKFGRVMS